jgi:hypothetical protein
VIQHETKDEYRSASETPPSARILRLRFDRRGIPALVFLMALLPRAIRPVSRAMLWYTRSIRFSSAVLNGELMRTAVRHHPGVTVCWLAGFGLQLFARVRGLTPRHLLGREPTRPDIISEAVGVGVLPLALTIALCIALSYFLIRRLAGSHVAFAAAGLLALDPFYIARSQVLHLDALLATFMLVSALFLLNHLRHHRWSELMLSGVFGGLAMLTKSPALFLVPYAALAVGVHQLTVLDLGLGRRRRWLRWLAVIARKVGLWTLVAIVTFVAIWPAMWVEPGAVLKMMHEGISSKLQNPHHNPTFFSGEIVEPFEVSGPVFYLATLGWKTTFVTLPMLGVAIVLAVTRLRTDKRNSVIVLLLAAYAVFYTAQMCLGARKAPRYILPSFLGLDVVAGFGVVWTAAAAGEALGWRRARWMPVAMSGALLILQAAVILPRHPYYGTLYNSLLGGAKTARHILLVQDEGEGVDLAAQYLNTLPDAADVTVGVDRNVAAMFGRTFVGSNIPLDEPEVDYRLYSINQVTRQLHVEEWGTLFALDRQSDPVIEIAFGGLPYVRVYRNEIGTLAPTEPEYDVEYRLGDHIRLERVKLNTEMVIPSRKLVVKPHWTADGQVERNYKVFCHLLSADRQLLAQWDDVPVSGSRPTSTWQPGEMIEDRYTIHLDRDAEPGPYELSIGMYDPESMERLPAYSAAGERVRNDRIVLGEIVVADIEW